MTNPTSENGKPVPAVSPEGSVDTNVTIKPVPLTKFFKYATWSDVALMAIGAVCATAVGAALPLFSIIFGGMIDDFNQSLDKPMDVGRKYALYFGYVAIAVFVAAGLQVGLFTLTSERQALRIRRKYLDALLKQEIAWFDLSKSGELTSKITENTVLIRDAMGEKFGSLFQFATMFLAGFAVGFYFSWQLTLVIFAVAPLLGIGGFLMMKLMAESQGVSLGAYSAAGAIAEETLLLIQTVAGFGMEPNSSKRYQEKLKKAEKFGIRKSKLTACGLAFTFGVMFLCYALALWYGTVLVNNSAADAAERFPYINGTSALTDQYCNLNGLEVTPAIAKQLGCLNKPNVSYTFLTESDYCACHLCQCGCQSLAFKAVDTCFSGGDVILVFFSVLIGSFALGQASPGITALTSGRAAAAEIYDIIARKPEIDSESDAGLKLDKMKGDVVFKQVTFAYPTRPEVEVLKSIDLEVKSGQTVALVGGSGCGKSTVTALLQRFYDPADGEVLIDGHNLKDLNLTHFRNQVALVAQEPVLFATTIAENIAYGAPVGVEVSRDEIIEAAKSANALGFINEFPEGIDTFITGAGNSLSGGQKQRIAIARALIRNPAMLILDEATSALDNESERVVQQALDKLLQEKKRTTIVIAHRLSTIEGADKIVVLGEGTVLEQGTHADLLARNGHYAALAAAAARSQGPADAIVKAVEVPEVPEASVMSPEKKLSRKLSDKLKESLGVSTAIGITVPEEKEEEINVNWKRIFQYSKPEKWYYIPAMLCSMGNGIVFPAFAFLFSKFLEIYYYPTSEQITANANLYALLFVALSFYMAFVAGFQLYLFGFIAEKMTTRVRAALFDATLRQEIGFFDLQENNVGAITGRLATDAALVKAGLVDRMGVTLQNIFTLLAGLAIAFYFGWKLTLILIALLPLIILGGAFEMMAAAGYAKADDKEMVEANQVLTESIGGIRTVTAFSARQRIIQLYTHLLARPMQLATKKGLVGGLVFGLSQGIVFTMYSIAIFAGSWLMQTESENYSFDTFFLVFFAIMMTGTGLGQAAAAAGDIGKAQAATQNVFKIVDRTSKIDPSNPAGLKLSATGPQDIVFENVSFKYPTRDAVVLDDFNLRIKSGSTVALVGQSGSGKSTIISLIERFYDPDSGVIKLGESDLTSLHIPSLRSRIGLVSQEPKLFATTIFENIALGHPSNDVTKVTMEEVMNAAKAANAHDFIMGFPDQYQTYVGSKGAQLSGGQKQRIAISRAIIRNPSILLLDEATSALDNESEKVVQHALDELMAKQGNTTTTVVIAHKLTTIEGADEIIVMDHGKVVERGTHTELLQRQQVYYKLYTAQKKQ